jgi:hypothetical protein
MPTAQDWKRAFDEPIALPDARELFTLQDAGTFITKLLKVEHEAPARQAAAEALLLIAEPGGRPYLGIMRALHHGKTAPEPAPRRKPANKYKIVR